VNDRHLGLDDKEKTMSMKHNSNGFRRFVTPLAVYLASLLIPFIVIMFISQGQSNDELKTKMYAIGLVAQALLDLPAVIMYVYLRMDREWGTSFRQHMIGIGVGLILAILINGIKLITQADHHIEFMKGVPAFTQSLSLLDSPWNVLGASAAVLAFGPGEAIWVAYFMQAFDRALGTSDKRTWITWGVVIGAVLWALPHLGMTQFYDLASVLSNTAQILGIGLVFGMALRGSKSVLAPIVFWTLINGTF